MQKAMRTPIMIPPKYKAFFVDEFDAEVSIMLHKMDDPQYVVDSIVQRFNEVCNEMGLRFVINKLIQRYKNDDLLDSQLPKCLVARFVKRAKGDWPAYAASNSINGEWLLEQFSLECGLLWADEDEQAATNVSSKHTIPKSRRQYDPKEHFELYEWLEHPKFGAGQVQKARGNRIHIKFKDKERILVHKT